MRGARQRPANRFAVRREFETWISRSTAIFVVSMLPDDHAVREAVFGKTGEDGLAQA
jgi:hypothetical protein